jgi:type II secretory pathway pseudopilin PulG
MTLTEVVVSAVILGISSQLSLQGWSRTSQAAAAADQLDQQLTQLEQRLLITRRVLATAPVVDRHCRFDGDAVDAALSAIPMAPAITEAVEDEGSTDGLWLTVAHGPVQRRQLLTPAGLGHCRAEVP